MPDDPKVVKQLLLEEIIRIRCQVFDAVKEGVKDSQLTVGAAESAAWDSYYAGLALAWNGVNVVGTLISGIPVLGSIPGAIVAGIGGIGAIYAGYQQNFNKPNFSAPQNLVDNVKSAMYKSLNDLKDQTSHYLWRLNPLKDGLIKQYGADPKYTKGLHQVDAQQERVNLIWKACFRNINPDHATNQVHDRTQNAVEALFKLVVAYYQQSVAFADGKVADLPSGGKVWKHEPGGGGYYEERPPNPADVARTRNAYLSPDKFFERLRNTGTYKTWEHNYKPVVLTGI
jgi:hypothetical protein